MKKPIVIIHDNANGSAGSKRCKDSAVAQQLTVANATNAQMEKILANLFCPISKIIFAAMFPMVSI